VSGLLRRLSGQALSGAPRGVHSMARIPFVAPPVRAGFEPASSSDEELPPALATSGPEATPRLVPSPRGPLAGPERRGEEEKESTDPQTGTGAHRAHTLAVPDEGRDPREIVSRLHPRALPGTKPGETESAIAPPGGDASGVSAEISAPPATQGASAGTTAADPQRTSPSHVISVETRSLLDAGQPTGAHAEGLDDARRSRLASFEPAAGARPVGIREAGALSGARPSTEDREPTEVHVHIGRIEVTAVHEPAPTRRARRPGRKPMSLDEYLDGRHRRTS
jgi:hypothetical protein